MTKRGNSVWIYLASGVALATVGWVILGGEQNLFSTAPAPVSVEVQTVVMSRPDDSGPPSYLYTVTLPDGTRAPYHSQRIYRPGDRVVVLQSRGKLTGRILLTTPAVDTYKANDRR